MKDKTDIPADTAGTDDDYTVPFSLRLTRTQRRQLDADAGSMTVGEYVRSELFSNRPPLKRTFRRPVKDEQALMQVLSALGRSRLLSNMNQMAKSANSGSLPMTPEVERAILDARAEIAEMRAMLVQALGLEPEKRTP